MTILVTVLFCLALLPLEWVLAFGTAKLLSDVFPLPPGTRENMARSAERRNRLIRITLGVGWLATIAVFVYIFSF